MRIINRIKNMAMNMNIQILKKFGLSLLIPALSLPAAGSEVRVYSGRHYNTDRQVFKQFSDQTGIRVRLIEATGISLVERLKREGKNSKADVILLVDAARINNAAENNLLAPINSPELQKAIPAQYRDPNNRWFGLTRRVRAIIVNPKIVNPSQITSYADLAKPAFKEKLCLRKRKNVYNQSLVADQILLRGETAATQWIKGMVNNLQQPFYSGDTSLIRAVGRGDCGIGVVNHYYLARMQAGSNGAKDQTIANQIKLIMPNPAHVNISAAGMTQSAKNKSEAKRLIEFLASSKGSAALAGPTYEYPLRGFGTAKELQAFGSFTPDNVKISSLGQKQRRAVEIMAQNGWR